MAVVTPSGRIRRRHLPVRYGIGSQRRYDHTVYGTDTINLSGIDNTRSSGNQAFSFIGSDRFHKVAGELHTYRLADGNT